MKPRLIALTAAVALGGGLIGTVGSGAQTPAPEPDRTQIRLFDFDGPYSTHIDVGRKSFGAGDSILEHHRLRDPATRRPAGIAVTHIRIVRPLGRTNGLGIVDSTLELPDGDIVYYGAFRLSELTKGVTFPVTGGTGAYRGAEGIVTAKYGKLGGRDGARITVDIATS